MAGKYYESESMDSLIKAVINYRTELRDQYKILLNAAKVCAATMGNDAVSSRHISELMEALKYLDKTNDIAEEVIKSLIEDKAKADDI